MSKKNKSYLKNILIVSIIVIFTMLFTILLTQNKTVINSNRNIILEELRLSNIELTEEEINWLAEDYTVKIRVGNWPPFMIIDEDNDTPIVEGIAIDYIETIFNYHNIKYKYIMPSEYTFSESLEQLKNNTNIDFIPTAKITNEREEYISFTQEYIISPYVIFSRDDSSYIDSLNDLEGLTISIPKGYALIDIIKTEYPNIKLDIVEGDDLVNQCIKKLASGEVDAYIGNLAVGSYLIYKNGYSNVKVASPTPFEAHANAMAIRSDWTELTSIINKTLDQFSQKNHSDISNTWLNISYEHGVQLVDIIKWVLIISVMFLIVLFLIIRWNNILQKEINRRKETEIENKKILAELETLANIDSLTGVYNRRVFFEKLEEEFKLSKRYGYSLCLGVIDIDYFKRVNDKYGHQSGDIALKALATTFRSLVRTTDIFGRIGGEEFGIIFHQCDKENAAILLNKMLKVISKRDIVMLNDDVININVSIGAVISNDNYQTGNELYSRADYLLYEAKKNGRNRLEIE